MSSTKPLLVYILCFAGRLGTLGFSSLDSALCWRGHTPLSSVAHRALELALDPCLIYVSSDEGMAAGSGTSLHWNERCNLDPVPAACLISPIKHCQVAHTLKHVYHCRWWRFPMYINFIYPKHDAVKILFCLDIGIWHPSLEYASCILLFVTCS